MYVTVDETLRLGAGPLEAVRRGLEERPVLIWSDPMGARMAASPAWIDAAETKLLARLAQQLPTLMTDVLCAVRRDAGIRSRLRCSPAALSRLFRDGGARLATFGASWPLTLRAFHKDAALPLDAGHRIDGYLLGDGRFRIMEISTGPTSWSFLDEIADRVVAEPGLADLVKERRRARVVPALAEALARRVATLAGVPEPVAAILSSGPEPGDVSALAAAFRDRGVPVHVVAPAEIRSDGRLLRVGADRVTILVDETRVVDHLALRGRWRLRATAWRAHRASSVVLHPMPYFGALGKGFLALLSEGSLTRFVRTDAHDLFREHLPWTRLTEPGTTTFLDGSRVELLEACLSERDSLVVKPLLAHSGGGIVFGDATPRDVWRLLLARAFRARDSVVQERLRPPTHSVVSLEPPGRVVDAFVDTDAVVIDGALAGVLQRYSTTPLTNYTAEGAEARRDPPGFLPTWTSEE